MNEVGKQVRGRAYGPSFENRRKRPTRALTPGTMQAASDVDPFVHNVAIKLSRVQNTINPNDLLARSVIDIAKSNTRDAFVKGAVRHCSQASAAHCGSSSCRDLWALPTALSRGTAR